MPAIAQHLTPTTRQDCIDTWRARGRIGVPSRRGGIVDVLIVHLYEASTGDGLPLDLVVEARASNHSPIKRFGVVFCDSRPEDDYTIPVLWWHRDAGIWL